MYFVLTGFVWIAMQAALATGNTLEYDDQGIGFFFFVLTYTLFVPGWVTAALIGREFANVFVCHFVLLAVLQLVCSFLFAIVRASRYAVGKDSMLAREIGFKRKR